MEGINLKLINQFFLGKTDEMEYINCFNVKETISINEGVSFFKKKIFKSTPKIDKIILINKTYFIFVEDGRIYMTYHSSLKEGDKLNCENYKYRLQLIPFSYFWEKYESYEEKWSVGLFFDELKQEFPFYKFFIEKREDCDCEDEINYIGCDPSEVEKERITLVNGDMYELTYVDRSSLDTENDRGLLDILYRFPDIFIKQIKRGKK